MNPLECIENGILTADWSMVCRGYQLLTGKTLSSPEIDGRLSSLVYALHLISQTASDVLETDNLSTNNEIKQNVERSSKTHKEYASDGDDDSIDLNVEDKTPTRGELGGVRHITNTTNPEEVAANEEKAAKAAKNKAQLRRQPATKYTVKCSECDVAFESDRPSKEFGQKCRKCLLNKKR